MPKTLKQYEDEIKTNGLNNYQVERAYRQAWEEYNVKDFAAEIASLSAIGDLERYQKFLDDFLHDNKKANYRGMISAEDEVKQKVALYKKTFLELEGINLSTESERKAFQAYINFLWQSCGFQRSLSVNIQQGQDHQVSFYLNNGWYDVDKNLALVSDENSCMNLKRLLNKLSEIRDRQPLFNHLSDLLHALIIKDYQKLEKLLQDPAIYNCIYQEAIVWQVAILTGTADELLNRIDVKIERGLVINVYKATFPHRNSVLVFENERGDLRTKAIRELFAEHFKSTFLVAAANNNVSAMQWVLNRIGTDVFVHSDSLRMAALEWASAYGSNDAIRFITAHKATSELRDTSGMTALDHAVVNGRLETVQMLILELRNRSTEQDAIKSHLSRALLYTVKQKRVIKIKINKEEKEIRTDIQIAELLGKEGADLNYQQRVEQPVNGTLTVLDWIFANDDLAMLQCLWDLVKQDSVRLIHLAARYGSVVIMQFLREKACDIQQPIGPNDTTALHIAAAQGYVDLVKDLIDKGAPTDVHDRDKTTPLSLAASNGHAEIVEYLLALKDDKKVNIKKVVQGDQTPLAQAALFDDALQLKARYKIFKAMLDTEDTLILGDDFIQKFELQPANEQQKENLKALQIMLLNSAKLYLKRSPHLPYDVYANEMMVVISDLQNSDMPLKLSMGIYLLAKEFAKEYYDDAAKVNHLIRCETLLKHYMKLIEPSRSEKFYRGLLTFAGLGLSLILGAAAIIGVGIMVGAWAGPLTAVGGVTALVTGGVTEVSATAAGVLAGGTAMVGGLGSWLTHRSCFWRPKYQLANVAREHLAKKEEHWELPLALDLARKSAHRVSR